MRELDVNPIIKTDYPDPDVIRVDDTYYMASTTMHFFPGGAILKSYDLINWEILSYLFDELDDNEGERLERECTNYGAGMWAPSLRYHDGMFYVVFVSHKTQRTYLFTSKKAEGPWIKKEIKGYYHDSSLLFDDDGRVFLVYGNTEIHLIELDEKLDGPKENGIDKIIVKDKDDVVLGYEGSHFYKINGKYYLFLIHWHKDKPDIRTEACFVSDSVDGEYVGKDVLRDDMGFFNQGVAQGGIVDTPNGKWFAVLFRDNGAVGRIPVLVPVTWKDDFPVFGINGKVPKNINVSSSRPYYRYAPLFTSDSFERKADKHDIALQWQWNHKPDNRLWEIMENGGLKITTDKICANVTHAKNCLTQRCMYPKCEASVTVDAGMINEGDIAGICLLQGLYGFVGITKDTGDYYIVKVIRPAANYKDSFLQADYMPGVVAEKIRISDSKASFLLKATFEDMQDHLDFFYDKDGRWAKLGAPIQLQFRLDHFCGARFGLFIFSTKECGGSAIFNEFEYGYNN